jgi:carbonic anhydrase
MSDPVSTNSLLARHATYLPTHQPFPTFAELGPQGKIGHIAVVTCADPRCIPENFLGIRPGEVIVFRNAGGNIQMALPNILAVDALIGINEVMVIKHTDCGSLTYTETGVKDALKERAPGRDKEIEEMEIGSIAGKTLEQGLREQLAAVKGSELVREETKGGIRAFVYDLVSGTLNEVEV